MALFSGTGINWAALEHELYASAGEEEDPVTPTTPTGAGAPAAAAGGLSDLPTFNVYAVQAEDVAKQITLLDLEVFCAIQRDELRHGAWMRKDKFERAPNVVKLTQRFNHLCFWVTREVLRAADVNARAIRLSYFIKLSKKLFDLSNFHSLLAVLSGLRSAPVYRLTKTWKLLRTRDSERFERLEAFMSGEENYRVVRERLATGKLPCIPHLGMFLTDLTHIETAARPTSDPEHSDRNEQVEEMLGHVLQFQASVYPFGVVGFVRDHLMSLKLQEGLIKMVQDENYRLSLEIEPRKEAGSQSTASSTDDSIMLSATLKRLANFSVGVPKGTFPIRLRTPQNRGHKKSRSLGNASFLFGGSRAPQRGALQSLLFDTEEAAAAAPIESEDGAEVYLPDGMCAIDDLCEDVSPTESDCESDDEIQSLSSSDMAFDLSVVKLDSMDDAQQQGILRRRTTSKLRKVWKRHWAVVRGGYLVLFNPLPKSKVEKIGRKAFKVRPCASVNLANCKVWAEADAAKEPTLFTVSLRSGSTLRFAASSQRERERWLGTFAHAAAFCPSLVLIADDATGQEATVGEEAAIKPSKPMPRHTSAPVLRERGESGQDFPLIDGAAWTVAADSDPIPEEEDVTASGHQTESF